MFNCCSSSYELTPQKLADKLVELYAKGAKEEFTPVQCKNMDMSLRQCNSLDDVLSDGYIDLEEAERLKENGFSKDLIAALRGETGKRPGEERAKWLAANINNKKKLWWGWEDKDRRNFIEELRGLLMKGTKKEFPELLEALNDDSAVIRTAAASALAYIGYSDETVINSLKTALYSTADAFARETIASSMITLGKGYEGMVVSAILFRPRILPREFLTPDKLGTAAFPHLLEGLEKLAGYTGEKGGWPILDKAMKHATAMAINDALTAIYGIYKTYDYNAKDGSAPSPYLYKRIIPLFDRLLKHPSSIVRRSAASALKALSAFAPLEEHKKEIAGLFVGSLTDSDLGVRFYAVYGLRTNGYFDDNINYNLQRRLMFDNSESVIRAAFSVLSNNNSYKFSDDIISAIFKRYLSAEGDLQDTLRVILFSDDIISAIFKRYLSAEGGLHLQDTLRVTLTEKWTATTRDTLLAASILADAVTPNDKEIIAALENLRDTHSDEDVKTLANNVLHRIRKAHEVPTISKIGGMY